MFDCIQNEHDLDIILNNLYPKSRFSKYILCEGNERKLLIIGLFLRQKGHYTVENCLIVPKI